jgi:Protein of unknown function (DUF5818)
MRYLLALSILLLGVSWAAAQNDPNQTTQTNQRQSAEAQTTVQGCLSNSGGNYTLTDKNGSSFQLTGDSALLSKHVGHEVKVTGSESSTSASSSGGNGMGQAGGSSQPTIQVSSLKHISKKCQSGSATQ